MGSNMTICLATICDEGKQVILMSDTMITEDGHLSIEFEHKRPKIIKLADNCAVATAGDALVHTELFEAVSTDVDKLKEPKISGIVENIVNCFADLRLRKIQEQFIKRRGIPDIETFYRMQQSMMPDIALMVQNDIDGYGVDLDVLVAGVDATGAHIHYVGDPGTSMTWDSIGYHAVGSGTPHAVTTLIVNDYNQGIPLNKALLITYEAKKIAERAPGVGSNTDVAIINNDGVKMFNSSEIQTLDEVYKKKAEAELAWKQEQDWENGLEELTRKKQAE